MQMLADGKSKAEVAEELKKDGFNVALLDVAPDGELAQPASTGRSARWYSPTFAPGLERVSAEQLVRSTSHPLHCPSKSLSTPPAALQPWCHRACPPPWSRSRTGPSFRSSEFGCRVADTMTHQRDHA